MDYFLLPPGFADRFLNEAELLNDTVQALLGYFRQHQYRLVEPPLMEFEETLLSGHGKMLEPQTFRLMDPLSHKMLGIRADLTAQIIRIASQRLKESPRPLRLCYAGDVVRTQRNKSVAPRQLRQIGCELIGTADARSDAEIIRLAIQSLQSVGIQNVTVDLSMGSLIGALCDDAGFDTVQKHQIKDFLAFKNKRALQDCGAAIFAELLDVNGPANLALAQLKKINLPKTITEALQPLHDVVAQLSDSPVSIDLLDQSGFEYYSGIGFGLFSASSKDELGRGGCYAIGQETGIGFSFDMDAILSIIPKKQ